MFWRSKANPLGIGHQRPSSDDFSMGLVDRFKGIQQIVSRGPSIEVQIAMMRRRHGPVHI